MRFFVDASLFFQTSISCPLCLTKTRSFCHLCNVIRATLCRFQILIHGIRLPINKQLRQKLNTSHTRYKRRPKHKISILAFIDLFAFENKHWFKISFSHTMLGIAPP